MSLKQSIAIMNEFSQAGSRGSTPGDFVKRYMLRDDACENVTPVLLRDTDAIGALYENRLLAAQSADTVPPMKKGMREAQGLGGIAFCHNNPSMSNAAVNATADLIQQAHDDGKTVFKMVISFDTEYLREMGVIGEDDEYRPTTGWHGKVDQMKLRLAIMQGMDYMAGQFDDFVWMGAIQVDKPHVHCHLAAVDLGVGRLRYDGQQRGMLSQSDMMRLRRFTDVGLQETNPVRFLSSDIGHSRRNVRCLVKGRLHELMRDHGLPQFLLACLPEDKRLWRADTNRADMRKANDITREFVETILAEPDSGWVQTRRSIARYADTRREREGLSTEQTRRLIANGEERAIVEAMDGVYQMLKQVDDREKTCETPFIDVMSMDAHEMASLSDIDPMVEFGFRLRSYSSRLDYHKKQRRRMDTLAKAWEAQQPASEPSRPLYEFYLVEREYQEMCMAKYQSFLKFVPGRNKWQDRLDEYVTQAQRCEDLNSMIHDPSFSRMKQQNAEDYGRRVYHQHGGSLVRDARGVLETRLNNMLDTLGAMRDQLVFDMAEDGLTFDVSNTFDRTREGYDMRKVSAHTLDSISWSFEDVKMMDLHHLAWDFPYDADVARVNVEMFSDEAFTREGALNSALEYLRRSGQSEYMSDLPVADVRSMVRLARLLSDVPTITSARAQAVSKHRVHTTRLDVDLTEAMRSAVTSSLNAHTLDTGGEL